MIFSMRKLLAVLFACTAVSLFSGEVEIGLGISPPPRTEEKNVGYVADSEGIEDKWAPSFHFGYSFAWLFYVSADSQVVSPRQVYAYTEDQDHGVNGYRVPGFLNTFNVGFRPNIGPLRLLATVGINHLYIYGNPSETNPAESSDLDMGVNFKAGLGWYGDNIGVLATGMFTFDSFDQMSDVFSDLTSDVSRRKEEAQDTLMTLLIPTFSFVILF